jgi:hypothetical protein
MSKYFSIAAIFKNESMGLKEWLDHHLLHGCEHFYLINDGSTDNFREILDPYIKSSLVTIFDCNLPKKADRQGHAYDKFLKPIWNETKWLAIIDLDEYLWSPICVDIRSILKRLEEYSQLEVNWVMFGSNFHEKQPKSIVGGFTKRIEYGGSIVSKCPGSGFIQTPTYGPKTILNTAYAVPTNFGVHSHGPHEKPRNSYVNVSYINNSNNPLLLINHYHLQSKEYWETVKMPRGDVNCWHKDDARDLLWYQMADRNDIDDFRLAEQNKNLIQTLEGNFCGC